MNDDLSNPLLGIMALYWNNQGRLEERNFFSKLIVQGRKMGLDAFVFTPQDVDSDNKRIKAHCYEPSGRWVRRWMRFPDIVFDRCRYQPTERFQQLRRFRAKYPNLLYMNRPMANKWIIHQVLSRSRSVSGYLPQTKLFTKHQDLIDLLRVKTTAYLKPINGTGGRGVMRISAVGSRTYTVQGRGLNRKILRSRTVSGVALDHMLAGIRKQGKYLLQEGLDTRLANGRVHDFRALVQKDGSGVWRLTGIAGRIGPTGSITSNLHGGGRAAKFEALLRMRFKSEEKVRSIRRAVNEACINIVKELEASYKDLCEMALDLAIDRNGRIWLIETNPKPAREVFAKIGEMDTYLTAIKRPLDYAKWLLQQK